MARDGGRSRSVSKADSVFCDTGILINYMNLEWERDHTSELVEGHSGDLVISESVEEEFANIVERRADIYLDFLEVVLEKEGAVEEFSPEASVPLTITPTSSTFSRSWPMLMRRRSPNASADSAVDTRREPSSSSKV
jgi:predicted nucleic acid-binding protein